MRIFLLGTTGYHPSENRHTPCVMFPELGLLFDAGTAMFRVRDHLVTDTLDIFLTHAHLDHIAGLTFLLDVTHGKSMQPVSVHGEASKLAAIQRHLFSEQIFPVVPDIVWRPLAPTFTLPDGGILSHFPVKHPGGAVGYRIDWKDRSLAYVTDTTASLDADYLEKIRGVDLLIHECYFSDGWEDHAKLTGHSCTTPVAQVAAAAAVGRLVLVHINPMADSPDPVGIETARSIFPVTEVGEDGMEIEF